MLATWADPGAKRSGSSEADLADIPQMGSVGTRMLLLGRLSVNQDAQDACFCLIAPVAGPPAGAGDLACRETNALKTSCIFINPAGIPSLTTTKVRVTSPSECAMTVSRLSSTSTCPDVPDSVMIPGTMTDSARSTRARLMSSTNLSM